MIDNLGFYKVGNTIFKDKIQAVLHASTTGESITWDFHSDIFNKINWQIEPELSLDQFYKLRATQIREEFDYVIVMCSGGADSNQVIWSFLSNGLHVDEIVSSAPLEGLRDYKSNNTDFRVENTASEIEYAQLPLLDKIAITHPTIKITLNDYFVDIVNYKTDEWLYNSSDFIHPTTVARYNLEKYSHLKDLAEQGKRIGIVYGIDKPLIRIGDDNNVYCQILDTPVNVPRPPFNTDYSNVEIVLFYWTPNMPLMLVKQVHVLTKWLHLPINKSLLAITRNDATRTLLSTSQHRNRFSKWCRDIGPCIYPSTYSPIYQSAKPNRTFFAEHDDWFYKLHRGTRIYQQLESDFLVFIKSVNPAYLNEMRTGFLIYRNEYCIGPVSQFLPSTIIN